ncbi:peptidylprolyl isomerase [uncultured Polaribacter sp.]|uniref:FKBP-type peptidyl-prolyl cis-trans isomerase n=1 Tax=uncultured Polaribacter sp. TaxID=174711 RepID=UPI00260B3E1C|nr:peptidylprolyl isomerase [uncultured Polaribacter sp.]
MNKIKNIFLLLLLGIIVIYSCDDDSRAFVNPFVDIDHEALAISDDDTLVNFLKNHYYDKDLDSVKPLISGKTPIYDDEPNLKIMDAKRNDIDYKLYVYSISKGDPSPDVDKGEPSISDSIFAKYSGQAILSTNELSSEFDRNTSGAWFTYNTLAVRGWSYGFMNFKGGYLKKESNGDPFNGPITYLNGGKGILFIPSGLAYTSIVLNNQNSPLVNQNLMFYIELLDFVKDTDHDNDGVPSYLEDANGDGDLENDFSDPSNPTFPDYRNPNIN